MNLQQLLARVRELDKNATPGPWHVGHINESDHNYFDIDGSMGAVCEEASEQEGNFIMHARTLLPLLADIVEIQHEALSSYARCEHIEDLENDLDTVSGEPTNWLCDSGGKFNLENGGVAREAQSQVDALIGGIE